MGEKVVDPAQKFDPRNHSFGPSHYFEDLKVGQRFYVNSRTQTEALFAAFQLASGDNHPIHYDRVYCQARGHRDMLAHGLQVAIQGAAGGGIFPHVMGDSLIGFIEQSSRFLKPVYVGDTLFPMLEINELRPGRTTGVVIVRVSIHNQTGELVMDGEHKYLVRKRPAGVAPAAA
ncbi:MAG: MaoC family dehydratase [Alphaproteobacteria bacterium]|nr:MaoC family dehydratase [Alphaproteobacteria bacterium]